jgi:hypothetical protein
MGEMEITVMTEYLKYKPEEEIFAAIPKVRKVPEIIVLTKVLRTPQYGCGGNSR